MHACRAFVVDLHPVHAEIALSRSRIARGNAWQCDKPSRIPGPALQDGEVEQRKIVPLDDLFTRACGHAPRKKLSSFGQERKHLELVEKTLRRLHLHEHAKAARNLVEGIDPERKLHAGVGTELIDEDLRAGMALQVLEQESGTALRAFGIAALGHAVSDFSNLKNRIGFGVDALQLTRAIERRDPLTKVVEGQWNPLCDRRL